MNLDQKTTTIVLYGRNPELDHLVQLLHHANISAISANDKNQCFEVLEQFHTDLILLDIDHADTESLRVCVEIKNYPQFKTIPVVLLSSLNNNAKIVEGLKKGAIDFISKTFNDELFLIRIKAILKQHKQLTKYNALFSQMEEGSCLLEPIYNEEHVLIDTRHIDYNQAYANLIPFDGKDLLNKTWLELMPDTDQSWFSDMDSVLNTAGKHAFVKEISVINKWIKVKVYKVSLKSFALVISDITEAKALEHSLKESNEKYRQLFTNLNASFSVQKIITDEDNNPIDYRFVEANENALKTFKLNRNDLIGKRVKEIFPDVENKWIKRFGEVGLTGKAMLFTDYSSSFDRYFDAHLYCPMPGYCASIFSDVTERVASKQALLESEEKYREIVENIGDWVWKSDLNLNIYYASPAVVKIRGMSIQEALEEPLESTFTEDSLNLLRLILAKKIALINEGDERGWEPVDMELQIYRNDKSIIWINTVARFTCGEDNIPTGIIGSARDINAQKMAEIALIESEKKYRSLFEKSSDPVVLIQEGKYVECNQATLNVFGYENKDEFLQLKPWHVSPKYQPDGSLSKEKALQNIQILKDQGRHTFEWLHLHKNGTPIWFLTSVARITLKGDEYFYTIFRDITKRKQAELELIKSEEKYRLIADNISDLVWKTDMNMNFTYVSPSIYNLRGYTPREAMHQNFDDILTPESVKEVKRLFQLKYEEVKNGDLKGWENVFSDLMLRHKDHSLIWVQISARFIKPESGLPKEIIGITRDITKQKLAEIALSESQQELIKINEDKDKFISILSHDLIGSIGGSMQVIEMLEHKGLDWDKRNTFINYLFENTKGAFDLLSNMVAWGKASLGKNMFNPKMILLTDILNDIKQLYKAQLSQKSIHLTINITPKQEVHADEHMLEAIFRNLLRNAIKFTDSEGSITISIRKLEKHVEIAVEDNGVGMDSDKAKQLFTLDHIDSEEGTKGEKGTGIGLQIAKEYVIQHKGKIWATSTPGKGTSVYFTIPKKPVL